MRARLALLKLALSVASHASADRGWPRVPWNKPDSQIFGNRLREPPYWREDFPNLSGEGRRQGYPDHEELIEDQQQFAVFDFRGKWAVFDFTEEQYFFVNSAPGSWCGESAAKFGE